MKKFLLFSLILCLAAGCATSTMRTYPATAGERSPAGNLVVKRVDTMNSGVFLFYFIPLWSGDERYPNRRDYDTFRNRLHPQNFYRVFDAQCEKNQKVESPRIRYRASGWLTLGLLWKRTMFGSALIVQEPESKKAPEKDAIQKK